MMPRTILRDAALILLAGALASVFAKPGSGPFTILGLRQPVRIVATPGHDGLSPKPSPARLCAYLVPGGAKVDCFEAKARHWAFFGHPRARVVSLTGAEKAVLFTAEYNGGGSGSSNLWALLVFGRNARWKNLLPVVTISEQGEQLYWSSSDISPYGLFSIADYIWGKKEGHFAAHRYRVETFEFCPSRGMYGLAGQFVTRNKFPSFDEVDTIRVIEPNLKEIHERLLGKRPRTCPEASEPGS